MSLFFFSQICYHGTSNMDSDSVNDYHEHLLNLPRLYKREMDGCVLLKSAKPKSFFLMICSPQSLRYPAVSEKNLNFFFKFLKKLFFFQKVELS